jgi:catechol 2,3-dioxygenase-like lactoylglutathione lyase family enzyme
VLVGSRIEAVVPVSDLRTALRFYDRVLGLKLLELVGELDAEREARLAAEGSLTIYESEAAGASKATLAAFLVDEWDRVVTQQCPGTRKPLMCASFPGRWSESRLKTLDQSEGTR